VGFSLLSKIISCDSGFDLLEEVFFEILFLEMWLLLLFLFKRLAERNKTLIIRNEHTAMMTKGSNE
jgi:hypothetical protein